MGFVVYDLEANTYEYRVKSRMRLTAEVIEIGACKLEMVNGQIEIVDHFVSLIKPVNIQKMSRYIRELTGLSQNDVDSSPELIDVLPTFKKWVGNDLMFCWGNWDKKLLYQSCEEIELDTDWFRDKHIDFQPQVCDMLGIDKRELISLKNAMKKFEIIPFGGQHNAGIDSLNTALLLQEVFSELDLTKCLSKRTIEKNKLESAL